MRIAHVVGLWLSASTAFAQSDPVADILEMPMSPGAVALLTEHATDPGAQARLTEALSASSGALRGAAARSARASGSRAVLPALVAALEREDDADAGRELMSAVASLGGASEDGVILEAARRLSLADVAASALASSRGARALAHLETLRSINAELSVLPFWRRAARGRLDVLGPTIVQIFRTGDQRLWSDYLRLARELDASPDAGPLIFGLRSEALRAETFWHVLVEGDTRDEIERMLAEVLPALPALDDRDADEAFVVELLWRRSGRASREVEPFNRARRDEERTRFAFLDWTARPGVLTLLTKSERRALSRQIHDDEEALDEIVDRAESPPPSGLVAADPHLRTVGAYPAGFVESLLRVTGCDPNAYEGIGGADVSYSLDGRPIRVAFSPDPDVSRGCEAAARALILNDIAPSTASEGKFDHVLVLIEPDFLACLSESSWRFDSEYTTDSELERVDGFDVEPPEKTRDIAPIYPPSARAERKQGTQILDATVTRRGCICWLRVKESTDDRLAFASILAVSRWRYDPARRDGVAVPIRMSVTVRFSLS